MYSTQCVKPTSETSLASAKPVVSAGDRQPKEKTAKWTHALTPSALTAFAFNLMLLVAPVLGQQVSEASRPTSGTNAAAQDGTIHDTFQENLFIRPLVDGKLLAHFQFKTTYRKDLKSLRWENEFQMFPLSVADLVAATDLSKLRFSLTKGNWNYINWGYPPVASPPGAQIRVQFSPHNENPIRSWNRLINSLSGKFCSSLASANDMSMVASQLAFGARTIEDQRSAKLVKSNNSSSLLGKQVFHANLPDETLCTENLTPWRKLLPCYTSSGLASLLNAVHLFKSSHSSLSMNLEPVPCSPRMVGGCELVQMTQTVSVVFNPLLMFDGKQMWSFTKIFGNPVKRACPLASSSKVYVDITDLDNRDRLFPKDGYTIKSLTLPLDGDKETSSRSYAAFDVDELLAAKPEVNIGTKQTQLFKMPPPAERPRVPVTLDTHVAGSGMGEGTIVALVTNTYSKPVRVAYMDVVPRFLRVFLHTLTIRTKAGQELKPDKVNYDLSRDGSSTLIEFSFIIPAQSETQISYDFQRAFLRWTEYKPDANKGVLLGSSSIGLSTKSANTPLHLTLPIAHLAYNDTFVELDQFEETLRIYARPLLIILPTPDFSMPYNVICLVSSVLVAVVGPIHNFTTRRQMVRVSKSTLKKYRDKSSKKVNKKEE